MTDLIVAPKTCARCTYWTRAYVGPETWGFCTWREANNRPRHPQMNPDSHWTLNAPTHYESSRSLRVLETRHDAGCLQFEPKR